MERNAVLTSLTKAWRPANRRAAILEAEIEERVSPPTSISYLHARFFAYGPLKDLKLYK